jgi:hypothetical protein
MTNLSIPSTHRIPRLMSMVNQVIMEGYLVRFWIHDPYRFLRLANQRPPEYGGQTGGRVPVESDYVTVRLDPSVPFDMQGARQGMRLLVHGRIEGRDIPETIGDILGHCRVPIALPREITSIQVSRPTVQICCTTLEVVPPQRPLARISGGRKDNGKGQNHSLTQFPALVESSGAASPTSAGRPTSTPPCENDLLTGRTIDETVAESVLNRAATRAEGIRRSDLTPEPVSSRAETIKRPAEKSGKKVKTKEK